MTGLPWTMALLLATCLYTNPVAAALQMAPGTSIDSPLSPFTGQPMDAGSLTQSPEPMSPDRGRVDLGEGMGRLDAGQPSIASSRRTVLSGLAVDGYAPDVALWLLIRRLDALRDRRYIAAFETDLTYFQLASSDPVAPIPLPASMWLLAMGLLGLVGTRLASDRTGRSAGRPSSSRTTP